MEFFRNTLYWHQILERNPGKLETLEAESIQAIRWLVENRLLEEREETLLITPLGYGAAISGLLPSTAVQFAEMLRRMTQQLSTSFEQWVPGLIYAACASDEFRGSTPSRYFPFPPVTQDSMTYWSARSVPVHLNRSDFQLAQCAHSVVLFAEGMAERKIAFATRVSAGGVHRIALDVAWILEGLHKISCVPDIGCPQTVSNQIGMLARRVRWGAPVEALDVMRVAERHRVPGFGRQRAMALIAQGIATVHDVVGTALDRLSLLLRNDVRAKALHDAASSTIGFGADRYSATHIRVAKELGIAELVEACNTKIGVEYEIAIANLLKVETGWIVTVLDDGARQNVPDLMLELAGRGVLIECKTCTKIPFIKKEDAWAVLQKAADFDPRLRRVTLGKPNFDETCKKKAAASTDITLAPHSIFMEAILRVHKGSLSSVDFLTWLSQPGISDISRLGGVPTFVE
jgi:helicase